MWLLCELARRVEPAANVEHPCISNLVKRVPIISIILRKAHVTGDPIQFQTEKKTIDTRCRSWSSHGPWSKGLPDNRGIMLSAGIAPQQLGGACPHSVSRDPVEQRMMRALGWRTSAPGADSSTAPGLKTVAEGSHLVLWNFLSFSTLYFLRRT